ncbi:MAG: response regulator [Nanoarchaeota archaeon]|nr:response regulator [Nanoarchaeota archaeon]
MKKILHFDDEEMLRNMYEVKFKQAGFEYVAYEHPLVKGDPIELVLEEKPDVIITDIIHPKMDGFTFLKLVKADSRTKDIPVILLTNIGQQEDIDRGMQLGAIKYLVTANIMPSEVVDEVRKVFGLPPMPQAVHPDTPSSPNYHRPTFFDLFKERDKHDKKIISRPNLQGGLFKYKINESGCSLNQAILLFKEHLLTFNPEEKDEHEGFEIEELKFLKSLFFDSGLPMNIVKAILSKLEKPYSYSFNDIYWDFGSSEWKYLPPDIEVYITDNLQDIIFENFDDFLESVDENDAKNLLIIRDAINNRLKEIKS